MKIFDIRLESEFGCTSMSTPPAWYMLLYVKPKWGTTILQTGLQSDTILEVAIRTA